MLAFTEHSFIYISLAISNLNTSRSAWDHLLVLYLQVFKEKERGLSSGVRVITLFNCLTFLSILSAPNEDSLRWLLPTSTNEPNKYRILVEDDQKGDITAIALRKERDTDISVSLRLNRGVNSPPLSPLLPARTMRRVQGTGGGGGRGPSIVRGQCKHVRNKER